MKSSTFNELVSEAYRVEPGAVRLYTRFLKEAGLLTTGRGGRGAPEMTPLDAARVTIALLATDKPARAVERLERFRNLPFRADLSQGPFPDALGIEEGATLESVLTKLFSSDLDDIPFSSAPYVEIHENNRSAMIDFHGGEQKAVFRDKDRTEEQKSRDRREFMGIRQMRGLASIELMNLHVPFWSERHYGKPWEELRKKFEAEGRSHE